MNGFIEYFRIKLEYKFCGNKFYQNNKQFEFLASNNFVRIPIMVDDKRIGMINDIIYPESENIGWAGYKKHMLIAEGSINTYETKKILKKNDKPYKIVLKKFITKEDGNIICKAEIIKRNKFSEFDYIAYLNDFTKNVEIQTQLGWHPIHALNYDDILLYAKRNTLDDPNTNVCVSDVIKIIHDDINLDRHEYYIMIGKYNKDLFANCFHEYIFIK